MKTLWKKFSTNLDAPLIYPALIVFAVWFFAANNSAAASNASAQATFATPAEAGQALQAAWQFQKKFRDKLRNSRFTLDVTGGLHKNTAH